MVNPKNCIIILLIAASVLLLTSIEALSQTTEMQGAREVSQHAQALMDQKSWEEAIEILENGLEHYGGQEQKDPRALLNFSLGYLYQQRSRESEEQEVYLRRAVKYYEKTLADLNDSPQVMSNLAQVYQSLGEWKMAVDILERAARVDSKNSSSYMVRIGDLYDENSGFPEAMKYYRGAAALKPLDEIPKWRILNIYRKYPETRVKELFAYSMELKEEDLLELAKDGFELVIQRSFIPDNDLAQESLIYWAEIVSVQGWVTEDTLKLLPGVDEWHSPAIAELHGMVVKPESAVSNLWWWKETYLRRHVAAAILKLVASRVSVNKDIERSARIYELALETAPEDFICYMDWGPGELRGKPIVPLDIILELATLYHKYPQLDPEGHKFQELINKLYEGKGNAYELEDLAAVQRFHTILGLIYAEKGQWESGWPPGNAIFQLRNALEKAEQRVNSRPEEYQPLPHLQKLLAEGYTKVGEKKDAHKTYVDAAVGYLDLDDLEMTGQMLAEAQALSSEAGDLQKERFSSVRNIFNTRQFIPYLQADNLNPDSPKYYRRDHQWLFIPANTELDTSFVERQRFKTMADMGTRASELGNKREALILQTGALELIQKQEALGSVSDIKRLKQIKGTVLQKVQLDGGAQAVGTGSHLKDLQGYKTWSVALPSAKRATQVGVVEDLVIASRIIDSMFREGNLPVEDIPIKIRDGRITIIQKDDDEKVRQASTIIKGTIGVKQVEIKKK